jgi:hypothetical protein
MSNLDGGTVSADTNSGTASVTSVDATSSPSVTILRVGDIEAGTGAVTTDRATETSASETSLGFCYSCRRQTRVNTTDFTCTSCHGGFIEMINSSNSAK